MGACVGYLSSNVKRTFRPKNWRDARKEYLKVPLDKISVNYDISDTEWLMTAMEDESQEILNTVNKNSNQKNKIKQSGKMNKTSVNCQSHSFSSPNSSSFSSSSCRKTKANASVSESASDYESETNPQTKQREKVSKLKSKSKSIEQVPLFWLSSDDEEEDENDAQNELLFNGTENENENRSKSKVKSECREIIGDSHKNHSQLKHESGFQLEKEETFSVILDENAKKLEECCERGDAKPGQLLKLN